VNFAVVQARFECDKDPGGDDEGMKRKDEVLGVKIVGGLKEASTFWAGASLLVELFRRCGADAVYVVSESGAI
jgi:hypothetical protein